MRHLNKNTLFILFLLLLAVIEGCVILYDIFHPFRNDFTLDTYTQKIAPRDTRVKPLLFEEKLADQVDQIAFQIEKELSGGVMQKIISYYSLATKDDIESGPESDLEDEILKAKSNELDFDDSLEIETEPSDILDEISSENGIAENEKKVKIAVVIDDMGISPVRTKEILDIARPMTAAFLTYDPANRKQVEAAKNAGFEVMLHVPMMPHARKYLAPVTLAPEMSKEQIQEELSKMIARYEGLGMKGANNHMGSLFTETPEAMNAVMEVLKEKNMFFLDSMTTSKSVGRKTAANYGVSFISRDVFLDNENNYDYVLGQLKQAEKIAQKRGYAVAIGHPHEQTAKALTDWVKTLDGKNIQLVHISELIEKK